MQKSETKILLYIITGALLGYLILHPASYFIIDLSENNQISLPNILKRSFTSSHLIMAIYFCLLGGIMGLLFFLYSNLEKKFYLEITDLNAQIGDRALNLVKHIDSESEDISIFIKQIWPVLNKIQTGVNLIADEKSDMSVRHRKELLLVTRENIASVFNLIDVMLDFEQNAGKTKS